VAFSLAQMKAQGNDNGPVRFRQVANPFHQNDRAFFSIHRPGKLGRLHGPGFPYAVLKKREALNINDLRE